MRMTNLTKHAGLGVASALLVAVACQQEPVYPDVPRSPAADGGPAATSSATTTSVTPPHGAGDINRAEVPSTAHVPKGLPLGVSPMLYAISVPADKVPTPEIVALGDKLFNDKRLSADDSTSCKTCHDPKNGFVDHKPTSEGIRKQKGQRNSPDGAQRDVQRDPVLGRARGDARGRRPSCPSSTPSRWARSRPRTSSPSCASSPSTPMPSRRSSAARSTTTTSPTAIAAFERTQYSGEAPFDRFINGDENAIDASAKRGWALFNGKGRCNACHAGNAVSPLFSDQKFHNIGIAAHKQDFAQLAREAVAIVDTGDQKQIDELALQTKFSELGRFLVTKQVNDIGAFKTPTLRNIAITAPYMHDGSLATLWDVMDHYNKGGVAESVPRRRHAAARSHRAGDRRPGALHDDAHERQVRGLRQAESWRGRRALKNTRPAARHRGGDGKEGGPRGPRARRRTSR